MSRPRRTAAPVKKLSAGSTSSTSSTGSNVTRMRVLSLGSRSTGSDDEDDDRELVQDDLSQIQDLETPIQLPTKTLRAEEFDDYIAGLLESAKQDWKFTLDRDSAYAVQVSLEEIANETELDNWMYESDLDLQPRMHQ